MRQATRETMLGTLAHRAVLMAFDKPQRLHAGHLVRWNSDREGDDDLGPMVDHVSWSTDLLLEVLAEPEPDAVRALELALAGIWPTSAATRRVQRAVSSHDQFSMARLCVDPAGAWWCKAVDDYFGVLTAADRDWVLRRLPVVVASAAGALQDAALAEEWKWMWSEVALAEWGDRRPHIDRVDLIVGIGGDARMGLAIDLKFQKSAEVKPTHREQLRKWQQGLVRMGFPGAADGSYWLLLVDNQLSRDPLWAQP